MSTKALADPDLATHAETEPSVSGNGARPRPEPVVEDPRWLRPARVGLFLAITAVLVWPVYTALTALSGVDYRPALDGAWIELRVHDVGGDFSPMVGPYTRLGANHPGPLMFYLLNLPYRWLGSGSEALLQAAALVNIVGLVALAAVAYRRGKVSFLLLTATLTSILLYATGPQLLRDAWNPWLAMIPFALLLLLAWSVSVGDLPLLPALAVVGTFLVQTHLGYAILFAYLGLWAITGLTITLGRSWRDGDVADRRRIVERVCIWFGVTIIATTVAWWPPVYEQLHEDNGNLAVLTDSMQRNDNLPVGFSDAGGFLSREIGGLAPWTSLGDPEGAGASMPIEPAGLAGLLVPAVPFAVAFGLAIWRRERDAMHLQITALVAVGASFLAFAMVDGIVLAYLVRWSWPVGMLVWLSTCWSLYRVTRGNVRTVTRFAAAPALAITLVWVSSVTDGHAADAGVPIADVSTQLLDVEDDVLDAVEGMEPVHVITGDGTLGAYAMTVGLQLVLEKNGTPIVVPSGDATRYGDHRTRPDVKPGANLIVVTDDAIPLVRQSPELELVALWQPRTDEQEREFVNLHTLENQERLTDDAAARLDELRELGPSVGIFLHADPE